MKLCSSPLFLLINEALVHFAAKKKKNCFFHLFTVSDSYIKCDMICEIRYLLCKCNALEIFFLSFLGNPICTFFPK